MIDVNFNKSLLKLFQELQFWERQISENEIPHFTVEIAGRKAQLLLMRDNVLLVVRDYNRYSMCTVLHFTSQHYMYNKYTLYKLREFYILMSSIF